MAGQPAFIPLFPGHLEDGDGVVIVPRTRWYFKKHAVLILNVLGLAAIS